MIFVDTGAWIARFYTADKYHTAALQWFHQNRQQLVTTDYIVDEALTLLKARGEPRLSLKLGELLLDGNVAHMHYLTESDIRSAWQVFSSYTDKEWSFTDCTSKVVIEKLGIAHAFSFDQHFHQFGTVAVVP